MNRIHFKALNVGLRGATLILRFFLVFFLAKFLEPSDVGVYGLVGSAVAFSLYIIGLDFYVYSSRELLAIERKIWGRYLKGQAALVIVMYSFFLAAMFFVYEYGLYSKEIVAWLSLLALLELCCQELNRLHIVTAEPLFSSFVLFVRQGLWIVVVLLLMVVSDERRTINTVFVCWSVACILSLALSTIRLSQLSLGGWSQTIDWVWVRSGVKTALLFLVGTLFVKAILTFDRFYFEFFAGRDLVGVYVFFMGVATALFSFLDAGVFVFAYPELVKCVNEKKFHVFRKAIFSLLVQVCALSLAFIVVSSISIPWLVEWISRPVYAQHSSLYFWLLTAMVLYGLSMVSHFGLYALRKDTHILIAHVFGFSGFFASMFFMPKFGVDLELVVPLGVCVSFSLILLFKSIFFVQCYSVLSETID